MIRGRGCCSIIDHLDFPLLLLSRRQASTFPSRTAASRDPSPAPAPPSPGRIDTNRSGPVAYNRPSSARKGDLPASEMGRSSTSAADLEDDDALAAEIARLEAEAAPPRISPVHVWGQADWGPGAGKWGMGPRALDRESGRPLSAEEQEKQEEVERLRDRRARLRRERALARGGDGASGEQ